MHRVWIDEHVDLSFASERWVKVVRRPASEGPPTNRRYLEVCVFSYLANELRSGDMCVQGSESFADYRKQLLPWDECLQRLPAYCERWNCLARRRNLLPPSRPSWRKPRSNWMTNSPLAEGRIDQRSRRTGIAPSDGARHPAIGHLATDGPHATHAGQARTRHHGQHRALDSVHSTFRADVRQRAKAQRTCRALPDDDLRHGLQPRPQPGRAASGR